MNAWIATKDPTKIAEVADRIAEQAPDRLTEVDGDREFAVWLLGVDRKIRRYTGVEHRDLPDWGWRAAYDDDLSPADAAADAIAHWIEFGDL